MNRPTLIVSLLIVAGTLILMEQLMLILRLLLPQMNNKRHQEL